MPVHPITYEECPMAPFQLEFFHKVDTSTKHKFHLNKGRQMGFSETVLRIVAFRACNHYAGKAIKIIAGTRADTTKKLMDRLKAFWRKIPAAIADEHHDMRLILTNGTSYEGLPANPEAVTGDTKIVAFVLDESTKWKLIDDQPVMNAIMPIVKTNHSDLFMFSTPNGPRGFFYNIEQAHDEKEWEFFKYSIKATEGNMYTKEQIESFLNDPIVDAQQEYLNQYTVGRNSIFGNQFKQAEIEVEEY